MRAAILHEFKQPLAMEDVAVPTPSADEVLIKIEACGVCHSDLSIAEGEWAQLKRLIKKPLIPGHEIVGRVTAVGNKVKRFRSGDLAGVGVMVGSCRHCDNCRQGLEQYCTIGGMVFGIGGLGHLAVQIAKCFGAQVIAVDVADDKLKLATQLGADQTMNASTEDVAKAFRNMGGVHAAIVASSSKAAYSQAFYAVRPAGTLVVVGLPSEDLSFPAIMMREIKIRSVATGTRDDMRGVLELAATGKIRCLIQTCRLEDVNQVFDQMRNGQIAGRIVIRM